MMSLKETSTVNRLKQPRVDTLHYKSYRTAINIWPIVAEVVHLAMNEALLLIGLKRSEREPIAYLLNIRFVSLLKDT